MIYSEDIGFINEFHRMTAIGYDPNIGVNRIALNEYDIQARETLVHELKTIGADIIYDDGGNILGNLSKNFEGSIFIGSHMDSVPNGGRFDGMYGVVAALNVLKKLKNQNKIKNNVTVVDFTNEEGSRFQPSLLGSGLTTEVFTKEFVYSRIDDNGITFEEALKKSGFMGSEENRIKRLKANKFLELHIEQGPVLEREGYQIGIPIGIVTLIVDEYDFVGESNQAGPTPMDNRKDALVSASRFITEVRENAKRYGENLVSTVGKIKNLPNAYNVIPGLVSLTLDIRSPDKKMAENFSKIASEIAEKIAGEEGTEVRHKNLWVTETTIFNEDIRILIEKTCKSLDLKYKFIYSWAGHDAQYMNRITDTAMIMVPSHNGRSHVREEFTTDKDLINGFNVLYKTVLTLI
jgi:N-carbamoyl-L-amino-acid hydrolase